jgi:hypothetical protein
VTSARYRVSLGCVASLIFVLTACGGSAASNTSASMPIPGVTAPRSQEQRDDQFITALGSPGAGQSRELLLEVGTRACSAFGEGASAAEIRQILRQKGLDDALASRVVLAATVVYCPEFKKLANP